MFKKQAILNLLFLLVPILLLLIVGIVKYREKAASVRKLLETEQKASEKDVTR